MSTSSHLLIFGASARAAAFSALRAGLQPWCADLFADADLEARCPVMRLPPGGYPDGFLDVARFDLPGPWMYTGGLENRIDLVRSIARQRPLWGNGPDALAGVRHPLLVAGVLSTKRLPGPGVWHASLGPLPAGGRWLIKPIAGAGGTGIRPWNADATRAPQRCYLQEHIDGPSLAAIYCGDGERAQLLGATWQLVGEHWLHAGPFRYCGSIGPLKLDASLRKGLQDIGNALTTAFSLRGLFGVDAIFRDGKALPVEVNPRFSASVEVLEHALGLSAMNLHQRAFEPNHASLPIGSPNTAGDAIGKAILFARETLPFPADGPWLPTLRQPGDIWELPAFADIPPPGQPIEAGRPILTFFARGRDTDACRQALAGIAAELDGWLYRK